MKKKITAIILSVVMLFSLTATPVLACSEETDALFENVLAQVIECVLEKLVGGLTGAMGENDYFVSEEDYSYENFYSGTESFITEAAEGASWSLGHGQASLVPENWQEYNLYLGGFINGNNQYSNDVQLILDDMAVRVIALNDGSGRGTAVFATIDSIGMTNTDIRTIRSMLSSLAEEYNINSINLFATHVHSGIDTQGLWTDILGKWPSNIWNAITGKGELQSGTDEKYMEFLFEKVSLAITEAVTSMNPGTMKYTEKDIGKEYFANKNRPSADSLDTVLKRFTFTPYDSSVRPTVILNMTAHPDVAGLPTGDGVNGHGVSADYVYYIGEVLNGAGYDFMFFNGAICGIYIGRLSINTDERLEIAAEYGREIGKMTLALTMSEEEILADDYLMSLNLTKEQTQGTAYTPWYENWEREAETEVEPILNIRLKTVELEVTNPIIELAAKSGLVNYSVKVTDEGKYYITTEIGYMEWGKNIRIAMVPGELCSDLAYGGSSLTAAGSFHGTDFEGKTLEEIFGEGIVVFGMANDAIGYIVPDNDYCMCLAFGHYHESISIGEKTASTIMTAFTELAKEIGI